METKVTYFSRSKECGPSIDFIYHKVYEGVMNRLGRENVEYKYLPSSRYTLKGMFQNLWFVWKNRNRKGVNHVTGEVHFAILALLGCKSVLTIHDLGFYTSIAYGKKNWLYKKIIFLLQIYLPITLATKVTAITPKTKEEILALVPSASVEVLNHVTIDDFVPCPKVMNKECPVVLQIGNLPHKNLETTIKALHDINCKLRVVKKMTIEQIELAKQNKINYTNVYNLSADEIVQEYINADLVVFPSSYEGFGAIIPEANSIGRAVITTEIQPMSWVANDAALFISDPKNEQELKEAVLKIINNDDLREQLVKRGYINAKRFRLLTTVENHVKLYCSINKV